MDVTQRLLEPARRVTVVYKQRLDERDTPLQAEVTWTPPACVVASLTGWLNEPQPVHEPSRSLRNKSRAKETAKERQKK